MGLLSRKGYECVTVSEKAHTEISQRTKETNRTMKEYIERLMAKGKDHKTRIVITSA